VKSKQKKYKFSKGEVNPKLLERQDLELLDSSASYIKNMISTPFGSLRTRQGTLLIDKVSSNIPLIPAPGTITSYAGEKVLLFSDGTVSNGMHGDITITGTVNIEDI